MLAEYEKTICRLPYADADWVAIVALLRRRPEAKVEARFRFDIESSAYLVKSGWEGKTKTEWIAAWKKVATASGQLRDALAVVMEEEIQEGLDAWCSDRINEANRNIRSIKAGAHPRRKNNNPAVAQVFDHLLKLWSHCGGQIRSSKVAPGVRNEGQPTGPLIRFLMKATDPIFIACKQKTLSADQLEYRIKKRRKENHQARLERNARSDDW